MLHPKPSDKQSITSLLDHLHNSRTIYYDF